jgi:hypothetical protein
MTQTRGLGFSRNRRVLDQGRAIECARCTDMGPLRTQHSSCPCSADGKSVAQRGDHPEGTHLEKNRASGTRVHEDLCALGKMASKGQMEEVGLRRGETKYRRTGR